MEKITVIIVCYNSADTLSAAIISVLRQTWHNLEIIIVDDGSDDESAQIADWYSRTENRIRVIRHSANKGILAARKTGVMAASGTWIMHLDADDMLEPEACEKAAFAIGNLQADFVQFGTTVLAEKEMSASEILLKEKKLCSNHIIIDCNRLDANFAILDACYRKHKCTYTQWNKIYKTELLKEAYGYLCDERICMGEDMYCLFVVMSIAKKMAVIEDRLYIYRFGGGVSCVNKKNPMESFAHSCQTMEAVIAVRDYVDSMKNEQNRATLDSYVALLRKEMLHRTVTRFYSQLPAVDQAEAGKILRSLWTQEELDIYPELESKSAAA